MSTPPSTVTAEPRPSPWLGLLLPTLLPLLALAVQWGMVGSDLRNLDRRQTASETELARVAASQAKADTQLARIETRLDGVALELARLARAVERLTQPVSARDVP